MTCDRFDQVLLVSSTNKTDCHDITEKLLKVVLNSITPTQPHSSYELYSPKWLFYSQVIEYKKKADDETKIQDALDEYKKKTDREMEAANAKLDEMKTINDRLEKSKKKLQQEVKINWYCEIRR